MRCRSKVGLLSQRGVVVWIELQQLDVENQYDATIIEPIFPIDPWYADNATDATINYETFMATLLPAWVDSNFATSGTENNLLIGFSKSGYGALDLLFKHPAVFDAVAAWDFPADMTAYNDYGANAKLRHRREFPRQLSADRYFH